MGQDRQRMFLERTTLNLKTKLTSDLNATKANRMRIMNVNREDGNFEHLIFSISGEFSSTTRIKQST